MSWPADGKPRFVCAEIHGTPILDDDGNEWKGGSAGPEAYVYDRADCHRIVKRFKRNAKGNRSAMSRAQRLAAALNAREEGRRFDGRVLLGLLWAR